MFTRQKTFNRHDLWLILTYSNHIQQHKKSKTNKILVSGNNAVEEGNTVLYFTWRSGQKQEGGGGHPSLLPHF
jgi:hypothetical protein